MKQINEEHLDNLAWAHADALRRTPAGVTITDVVGSYKAGYRECNKTIMTWNKISEVGYPVDGQRVLVWDNYYDEARILYYNGYHKCWDDEQGDDYECGLDVERIPAWCDIPYQKPFK